MLLTGSEIVIECLKELKIKLCDFKKSKKHKRNTKDI